MLGGHLEHIIGWITQKCKTGMVEQKRPRCVLTRRIDPNTKALNRVLENQCSIFQNTYSIVNVLKFQTVAA